MIYLTHEENNYPLIDNSFSQLNFLSKLIDVKEDDVDLQLHKIDGRIPRQKDPQLYLEKFF
jgi:hypothetical protein